MCGDKVGVRSTVETIIAEERHKQHKVLADRLMRAMDANGVPNATPEQKDVRHRGREFIAELTPRRQLADMVLSDTCQSAVNQLIEEQQRTSLLRAHGLDPRHRMLLVGPPGNGKTTLAEAVAEALAVPFFLVRYDAMIGSYLGETAGRLKRMFEYVRTTPCVLFFDEFDAVGKERGDIHETGEIKRVVTSLLMHVDDLPSYTVVIAATNHSELLDRAVWRRFQVRLHLPAPTDKELSRYFARFLASVDRDTGVTPDRIARRLSKVSYAEAEEFVFDVLRRDVMTMKTVSLRDTIEEQLEIWEERIRCANSEIDDDEDIDG